MSRKYNSKSYRIQDEVVKLYKTTKLSSVEIAKKMNTTPSTVKIIGRRCGIDEERLKPPVGYRSKSKRNDKIMSMIKSGKTYEEIGKKFSITKQRVYQIAVDNGFSRWKEIRMSKELMCDFCKVNEAKGIYAVDHGPFSLAYCEECLKHPNIRTLGNGLSKWGRFGDKAFDEYHTLDNPEPNVYFNGEYITLRELINVISIEDVEDCFGRNPLASVVKDRLIQQK
jgi:DNA-binding CsgD family transcriptional regulator